jgi:hypothetical protein
MTTAELAMTATERAVYFVRRVAAAPPVYKSHGHWLCKLCAGYGHSKDTVDHYDNCKYQEALLIALELKIEGVKP